MEFRKPCGASNIAESAARLRGKTSLYQARAGVTTATLREINLVSLVFEGLGAESRREAAQAAKDFLANNVDPNTYTAVFALNHRLGRICFVALPRLDTKLWRNAG